MLDYFAVTMNVWPKARIAALQYYYGKKYYELLHTKKELLYIRGENVVKKSEPVGRNRRTSYMLKIGGTAQQTPVCCYVVDY